MVTVELHEVSLLVFEPDSKAVKLSVRVPSALQLDDLVATIVGVSVRDGECSVHVRVGVEVTVGVQENVGVPSVMVADAENISVKDRVTVGDRSDSVPD